MKSKRLSTREQLRGEVKLADLIWVRIHGSSWWPAQVVDEKTVSRNSKPSKRSADEVLVRLYGSYKYLYVNPLKFRSDFDSILKENNGCYRKLLLKSLMRDVSSPQSGRSKNQRSEPEEKEAKRKLRRENGSSDEAEVRARRLRVMQHLGLVAPSGSPFHKNGLI